MRIGYPCLNHSVEKSGHRTFRLASYSEERFLEAVEHNLAYLEQILEFNLAHDLKFFRISSDVIPFGSHPVLKVNWQKVYSKQLAKIGAFIKRNGMRISMHPDQFVLINAQRREIVDLSIKDLLWHAEFLNSLGLNPEAKIQIHVGGVYGDKPSAIRNFIGNYLKLPEMIRERLVIENDDRSYALSDCMKIHEAVGVPILFDNFHHQCLNHGETLFEAMLIAQSTWKQKDGVMMVDYSQQEPKARVGCHANTISDDTFKDFIISTQDLEFDVMLEIKDKEHSALRALDIYKSIRMVA